MQIGDLVRVRDDERNRNSITSIRKLIGQLAIVTHIPDDAFMRVKVLTTGKSIELYAYRFEPAPAPDEGELS